MNPWHDVALGEKFPEVTAAVVEIPKGSNAKYKLDAKTGMLKLGKFLPTVARYPANYGFFPRTIAADGDALDVFIFGQEPIQPLTMLEVRPIGGVIVKSEKKGKEFKIVAVFPDDPEFNEYKDLKDLPDFYIKLLCQFFEEYKSLAGEVKEVTKYLSKKEAHEVIRSSADDYLKKFNHNEK
jgi:inorganic pyrophosphatase